MRIKHKIHRFLFHFCETNERHTPGKACGAASNDSVTSSRVVSRADYAFSTSGFETLGVVLAVVGTALKLSLLCVQIWSQSSGWDPSWCLRSGHLLPLLCAGSFSVWCFLCLVLVLGLYLPKSRVLVLLTCMWLLVEWRCSCECRPLGENGGQQTAAEESSGKQVIHRLVKYSKLQVWGISTKQYLWGWGEVEECQTVKFLSQIPCV